MSKMIFALVVACLGQSTIAWHSTGHMVVAQVAYLDIQQNNPSVIAKAEEVLAVLGSYSKDGQHMFIESAEWADDLKEIRWVAFNPWHYDDHYYIRDFKPDKLPENTANIVWALQECISTLKRPNNLNKIDKSLSRSFMLRFLFHLIGDVHQPLHNASLVDADFPEGDKGGNSFKISAGSCHDLHSYWDSVLQSFHEHNSPLDENGFTYINKIAEDLLSTYSRSHFADDLREKDFEKWSLKGLEYAKTIVYDGIEPGDKPTQEYYDRGFKKAKELITLAGYRLADILTHIYGTEAEAAPQL